MAAPLPLQGHERAPRPRRHSLSAEVVARYFFDEVRKGLGAEGGRLRRVRVWEAPGCTATYRP